MALFSRRPKGGSDQSPDEAPEAADAAEVASVNENEPAATAAEEGPAAATSNPQEHEPPASVDISVSSFQGLGAPAKVAPSAAAAAPPTAAAPTRPSSETIPGLRDNVLLREALAALTDPPTPIALLNVARQLLQGHLFLRVKGDVNALLAAGKELPLAIATVGDRNFALAYSSGAALQASVRADGDVDTSAMGQPVLSVLQHVLKGRYEGMILDHASGPARAALPRDLLQRLVDQADPALTLKTLLAGERTPDTTRAVAEALTRSPLWVAVGAREGEPPGIAEGRTPDGSRMLEIYSHPLEVAVMGRSDQPAPLTAAQLAGALRSDPGISAVVVDPPGPWIQLSRADLAPLLALAD